jgi:hypothetical protein
MSQAAMRQGYASPLGWRPVLSCAPGCFLFLALAGCATKADIEAVQQQLQASTAKVSTDTASQQELLKQELKSELDLLRKQMEERDLKLGLELSKLTESLRDVQLKEAEARKREESLQKQTQDVLSSAKQTTRSMLDFLKAEESQLKEGLKWIQGILKDLSPEAPKDK